MSLEDYVVQTKTTDIPGGSITVRGLSLQDLSPLLTSYRPQLQAIWSKIEAVREGKTLGDIDIAEAIQIALEICPPIVGGLIAMAADEAHLSEKAARLPISAQVDAIDAISTLTFEQNGGSAKLWEAVIKMIKGVAVLAKPQVATLIARQSQRR